MIKNIKIVKILVFSLFFMMIDFSVFSQQILKTQQILSPKRVYIGDTAQLQCSFNSDSELLKNLKTNETKELSFEGFTKSLNSKEFEIKKIEISSVNTNFYNLTLTFIPWKTGNIIFPEYNLSKGFNLNENISKNSNELIISFNEINIVSIIQQNSITSPKSELSPFLLPGTNYKIYLSIIILLVLIFALIQILCKHKKISTFLKNQKLLRKYKKNKKITQKQLKKLKDSEKSDKEICENIQKLLRKYLSVRFEFPFENCGSSEIMNTFYKSTNNLYSEKKESAMEKIVSIFIRTDFIRYSNNSYEKIKSNFLENEKFETIDKIIEEIENLES